MHDSERLSADKTKLYGLRESFNLYELACLAHGADPELVAYNVHDEVAAHVREVHGDAWPRVALSDIAVRVGTMPESTLGPEIGSTLKALCVATGGTFQRAVSKADARRLLTVLGLSLLGGPESPDARRARRLRRFYELGGKLIKAGESFHTAGKKGALQRLIDEEKAAARPMSDKTDVRGDLAAARRDELTSGS